jgi:hypothetical protein
MADERDGGRAEGGGLGEVSKLAPGVGAHGEGCIKAGILDPKIMVVEHPPTDPSRDVWGLGSKVEANPGAVADSVGEGLEGGECLVSTGVVDEMEHKRCLRLGMVPRRARHTPWW